MHHLRGRGLRYEPRKRHIATRPQLSACCGRHVQYKLTINPASPGFVQPKIAASTETMKPNDRPSGPATKEFSSPCSLSLDPNGTISLIKSLARDESMVSPPACCPPLFTLHALGKRTRTKTSLCPRRTGTCCDSILLVLRRQYGNVIQIIIMPPPLLSRSPLLVCRAFP